MPMANNQTAAWLCVLAGIALHAALLAGSLAKRKRLLGWAVPALLLPGVLGLLFARGGFLLFGFENEYSTFRWCYTTGLLGLTAGTAVAARAAGTAALPMLDDTAAAACLCMAAARLSQRWLGETGVGPILESEGFLAMINEWQEPVLATWLIEAAACLLAAAAAALWHRRKPRAAGGTFCAAVHLLLDPQILLEQFRSGEYLRFMMMRLEQALYALFALAVLLLICVKYRKTDKAPGIPAAFAPAAGYLLMAAVIALTEFMLDGKLADCPETVCWGLFGFAVAAMAALALFAVRRLDRAGKTAPEAR